LQSLPSLPHADNTNVNATGTRSLRMAT
jgi:hypothetical protein